MSFLKEKYWDLCAGIFLFLFSIALFYGGMTVKTLEVSTFGSGFFPKILAVLLALTSVPIILGGANKAKADDSGAEQSAPMRWQGVLMTFGLMTAYAGLISVLGFMITTAVYLFLQMNILAGNHNRRLVLFAIVSAVSAVLINYTFVKVFNLMLPAGFLG